MNKSHHFDDFLFTTKCVHGTLGLWKVIIYQGLKGSDTMFALKDYITSEDVKNLRKNLGLTQKIICQSCWNIETDNRTMGKRKC